MKAIIAQWLVIACSSGWVGASEPAPFTDIRSLLEAAASVRPDPRQLEWQRLEFNVFIHFGMNTFTSKEWGNGREDVKLFNPSQLNCSQ